MCSVSTSLVLQIIRVLSMFSSMDSYCTASLVKIHICSTEMVLLTCCQMLQMSSLLHNRALGLVCSHQSVQCIDWFVSVKWSFIVILDMVVRNGCTVESSGQVDVYIVWLTYSSRTLQQPSLQLTWLLRPCHSVMTTTCSALTEG